MPPQSARRGKRQWRCGTPVPQRPQERGLLVQAGASVSPPVLEAKTDSFFSKRTEPQSGHRVPCQSLDRTSSSLSFSQSRQWNS